MLRLFPLSFFMLFLFPFFGKYSHETSFVFFYEINEIKDLWKFFSRVATTEIFFIVQTVENFPSSTIYTAL